MQSTDEASRAHLHASLALLPVDATQVNYLFDRLKTATPAELAVLRDALKSHRAALAPKLWTVLESANPGDFSLLPAASALASYAPDDPRWEAQGAKVAQALVSVNSLVLGTWLEALRPVRGKLTPPLTAIFEDNSRSESVHSLATDILTDYASDDPDSLAELLLVAEPKAYSRLFPLAEKWTERVLPRFHSELSSKAAYPWNDPPLEDSWTNPDEALVSRIELEQGLIAERFAFCQTMRLDDFDKNAAALSKSGYRPVRLRPYADGHVTRVAAVWNRDGRAWRASSGLTAEDLRQTADRAGVGRGAGDGPGQATLPQPPFVPVDVAGYVATGMDGKPTDRYAALWVEKSGDDDPRLYVGMTAEAQDEIHNKLKEASLIPRTQNAMIGSDGRMKYCGVWGRPPRAFITGQAARELTEGNFEQRQAKLSDEVLLDISVSAASNRETTPLRARTDLQDAQGRLRTEPNDTDFPTIAEDIDRDPIPHEPAGLADRRYAGVWSTDSRCEAIPIYGVDPAVSLRTCRKLIAQGYRPVSWSVTQTATAGPLVTASVWHRPVIAEETKDRLAERQARAAVALVRMEKAEEVWPLLRHSADPRLRSFIVNWMSPLGADQKQIAALLGQTDPSATPAAGQVQQKMAAILFHPETSLRRALILALGKYPAEGLSAGEREPLIGNLLELYRNDPDSGIHAAAEWTLRQWKQQAKLTDADAELMNLKDRGDRRWYVNSQRQTFALIEGPLEFRMGSPLSEPKHDETMEISRRVVIPRHFAIAAKEVTLAQWQKFERTHTHLRLPASFINQYTPDPDGPRIGVNWYTAAQYCNWLSEQEGLSRDQWCYRPLDGDVYGEGMTIPADVLKRRGYRLPTEAEWEYACRAGALTSRYYGYSINLLDAYAWNQSNSKEHSWSCGSLLPNDLGLFDMLGNAFEWVGDRIHRPMPERKGLSSDTITASEVLDERSPRLLRGGAFYLTPAVVRAALRLGSAPSYFYHYSGFRPARTYD